MRLSGSRGFLVSEQHPELGGVNGNGTITYPQYDARGHVLRKFDGESYLTFEYDRAERLHVVREADSDWDDVRILRQFDYAEANDGTNLANGKLSEATANNILGQTPFPVVETYTYAGVGGRVSRRSTSVDGRTIDLDVTWTDLGKPWVTTYPDDDTLGDPSRKVINTYTWGLLTGVCEGSSPPTCQTNYTTAITYHANLMLNQVTNANATKVLHGKDANDMLRPASFTLQRTSDSYTLWSTGTYAYDGAGNIKAIGSEAFVYDKVLRLTSGTIVSSGNKTQTASYTPYGFMLTLNTNGVNQSFTEVSGTNLISGPGYSNAGSMESWGGFTYTWDPLNQLKSISGGVTTRTFLYTADGERIEERIGDALDPDSVVLSARGLDGNVLRLFTNDGTWAWTKDYVYRDGAHLASVDSGATKYFHLDHLGTIRRITNTATPPAIIASHDYYPFGFEATATNQDTERFKWAGYERDLQGTTDQVDDLDYLHARYENFNIGRFLSVDPVRGNPKRPQSFNLFAYVGNNPINRIDPLGLTEATTSPQPGGGQTKQADGNCASQEDATDPDCEAFKRKQAAEFQKKLEEEARLVLRNLLMQGKISPREWLAYIQAMNRASRPGQKPDNSNYVFGIGSPTFSIILGKSRDRNGFHYGIAGLGVGKTPATIAFYASRGFNDVPLTADDGPAKTDWVFSVGIGGPGPYISRSLWSLRGQPLTTEMGGSLLPQAGVMFVCVYPEEP